jgi:hypothetical protein
MANTNSDVPEPPWFEKPTFASIPNMDGVAPDGTIVKLPYMRYGLVDNEPMLLGTAGRNQAVYGEHMQAIPVPTLPFSNNTNNEDLNLLYTDYPFNWTLNLALYQLSDAGVLADVHCYRSTYTQLHFMKQESTRISHLLIEIQKEQEKYNAKLAAFIDKVQVVRKRLIAAKVMTRVDMVIKRMAVEKNIANPFYPQVYKEEKKMMGTPISQPPL